MLEDDKNMPIEQDSDETKKHPHRGSKLLDDDYINAYCGNPKAGKKEALLAAGFTGSHAAQEAYRVHKRLESKIKARTTELINTLDTLAAAQLESILASDVDKVGYANMTKVIQMGLDYNGRKQAEQLIVTTEMTQEERRERIEYLQAKNSQVVATKH